MIVEYCRYGNLRSYLLKHKDHFQPTLDYVNTDPVLNVGKLENICINFTGLSEGNRTMLFSICMHLGLVCRLNSIIFQEYAFKVEQYNLIYLISYLSVPVCA